MNELEQAELKARFAAATDSFIDKIKDDPNVIAVIVSGSVAYDVVWEKSDIDMTVVVRDQPIKTDHICVIEDGILINVYLMTRSDFRRGLERNIGGSFSQSYFAKGKMVYTADDSLLAFFEDLKTVGKDDIALSSLHLASYLLHFYEKSQKWLYVRRDPLYAQYYLLQAAESIAHMELCLRGEPSSRESIQKAIALNPEAVLPFYRDAMTHLMTEEEVAESIRRLEGYLEQHVGVFSRPVIEYLSDQELKTVTLIAKYFSMEAPMLIGVLDYLADKGVIEKVSQTVRITPKSRLAVEEIGYLFIP